MPSPAVAAEPRSDSPTSAPHGASDGSGSSAGTSVQRALLAGKPYEVQMSMLRPVQAAHDGQDHSAAAPARAATSGTGVSLERLDTIQAAFGSGDGAGLESHAPVQRTGEAAPADHAAGAGAAEQTPGAATAPQAPVRPPLNTDNVPDGIAKRTVEAMAQSANDVEYNTARALCSGNVTIMMFSELTKPPNQAELIAANFPGVQGTVYENPSSVNVVGTAAANYFIVSDNANACHINCTRIICIKDQTSDVDGLKTTLIHESSHAINAVQDLRNAMTYNHTFATYLSEFRAYWVADFGSIADLEQRADTIRQHIIRNYAGIQTALAFEMGRGNMWLHDRIWETRRPEGNTTNTTNA